MHVRSRIFLDAVIQDLEGSDNKTEVVLLKDMITSAKDDPALGVLLLEWCSPSGRKTSALFEFSAAFGKLSNNDFFNQIAAIDSAAHHVRDGLPLTARTVDDRLFPSKVWDTGWSLSIQADKSGYDCWPRERLAHLEDYDNVEVVITHPDFRVVDPELLGLHGSLIEKFTPLFPQDGPSIGQHVTWEDVEQITQALNAASLRPNAGIPLGDVGWSGATVWHGTDQDAAEDIRDNGISLEASGNGYFGIGFYVAEKRDLSVSNYASVFDDQPGAVVRLCFQPNVHVLDLRNEQDAAEWSVVAGRVGAPDFDRVMRRAGIDAVYDRAMGGLAIYRRDAVEILEVEFLPTKDERPQP